MKISKVKYSFIGLISTAVGGALTYMVAKDYLSVGADVINIADTDISKGFMWIIAGVILLFIGIFYLVISSFH